MKLSIQIMQWTHVIHSRRCHSSRCVNNKCDIEVDCSITAATKVSDRSGWFRWCLICCELQGSRPISGRRRYRRGNDSGIHRWHWLCLRCWSYGRQLKRSWRGRRNRFIYGIDTCSKWWSGWQWCWRATTLLSVVRTEHRDQLVAYFKPDSVRCQNVMDAASAVFELWNCFNIFQNMFLEVMTEFESSMTKWKLMSYLRLAQSQLQMNCSTASMV